MALFDSHFIVQLLDNNLHFDLYELKNWEGS